MNAPDVAESVPPAHTVLAPMSWLVFSRWMVGALFVCFANPWWVTRNDPWLMTIGFFLAGCAFGAVPTGFIALFFTPKPLGRLRKVFVIATWSLLLLSLYGQWDIPARQRVSSAWSAISSKIVITSPTPSSAIPTKSPMTQAELVEKAKALNATMDRTTSSFPFRHDSVWAEGGLRLIDVTTTPAYTASEMRAWPGWPILRADLQSSIMKESCGPNLLKDDSLQRGVTRSYVFRGNDGLIIWQIDISKKICEGK